MVTVASNVNKNIRVTYSAGSGRVNVGVMWDNGQMDGLYEIGKGKYKSFTAPAGVKTGTVYAFAMPGSGTFEAKFYVGEGY